MEEPTMTRPTTSGAPQQSSRNRTRRPMPSSTSTPMALSPRRPALLALFLLFSARVAAREIIATHEWQRLGENDTVPAGLHVRMDLTSGEKWAKIPAERGAAREGGTAVAEMAPGGALTVVDAADDANDSQRTAAPPPGKDYDMMHRVMSKLPPEEVARFGGLPGLPAPGAAAARLTAAERQLFERRMEQLWVARQEELARVQEEDVADLPKMLRARIRVLREHLDDVPGGLRRIVAGRRGEEARRAEEDAAALAEEEEGGGGTSETVTDVVAALRDLEYQLSDVDMARDFHTLGGWPYLVALLDDGAVAEEEEGGEELPMLADEIRALAAMTVGTAVGNVGEFRGWALEDVAAALNRTAAAAPTSALDALVASFRDEADRRTPESDGAGSAARRRARATYKLRAAYALGSLARGNPAATRRLVAARGAVALARDALGTLDAADAADAALRALEYKFASKALALGEDVVVGVALHAEEYATAPGDGALTAGQLVAAFTADGWCALALRLLAPPAAALGAVARRRTQERALSGVRALAPGCQARGGGEGGAAAWGAEEVRRVRSEWNREGSGDGLDPTYRRELLELADGVLVVLQ